METESRFKAVLNEGAIHPTPLVELPQVVRGQIIPEELWEDRKHTDVRIARRAATISRLSQMISEREVSGGMRRTLLLQAQRLEWLAGYRIGEMNRKKHKPARPGQYTADCSLGADYSADVTTERAGGSGKPGWLQLLEAR